MWGAGVVALALITALIVPNVMGRRIVGSPSRVPVAGPPAVGDCLHSDIEDRRSALAYISVTIWSARVGPCGDGSGGADPGAGNAPADHTGATNDGEVVSVTLDAGEFPSTVANRVSAPEVPACRPPATDYLGWDVPAAGGTASPPGEAGGPPGSWRPTMTESVALIGPDIGQYLSGQHWLACVILPRETPYSGSVRNGVAGPAADAFGACLADSQTPARQGVPCGQPHDAEVFGTVPLDTGDARTLLASCQDLVAEATGLTDTTAGGALTVHLETGGSVAANGRGTPAQAIDPVLGSCTVTVLGDRLLRASLTGVGTGPLPLA